jgi:hypothetical protein
MDELKNPLFGGHFSNHRLWFLYLVAGLSKREMEEVTGWQRGQIDHRLRKWDLTRFSYAFLDAVEALKRRAFELGYRPAPRLYDPWLQLQHEKTAQILRGEVTWEHIDEYPGPYAEHEEAFPSRSQPETL